MAAHWMNAPMLLLGGNPSPKLNRASIIAGPNLSTSPGQIAA
jgi:hypothetical protein